LDLSTPLIELDVVELAIALLVGIALSVVLSWQFVHWGRTFSNRRNLAYTIPLLTIVVILIISVVKSSLALSLGLVGALSIVRFRTPIKEPEELAHLFMAIGLGIALGANQLLASVVGYAAFFVFSLVRHLLKRGPGKRNLFVSVSVVESAASSTSQLDISGLVQAVASRVDGADLRRADSTDGELQATFYVEVVDDSTLVEALDAVRAELPPGSSITFIDQDNSLGA
jgi:uncharacterized membrane protein YhiD involved in acid resistance